MFSYKLDCKVELMRRLLMTLFVASNDDALFYRFIAHVKRELLTSVSALVPYLWNACKV